MEIERIIPYRYDLKNMNSFGPERFIRSSSVAICGKLCVVKLRLISTRAAELVSHQFGWGNASKKSHTVESYIVFSEIL